MKYLSPILLILTGIPLALYPFVLLANVMQLPAALSNVPPTPLAERIPCLAFIAVSSIYPVVFVFCAVMAYYATRRGLHGRAAAVSLLPSLNLALAGGCFWWWWATSR